MILSYRRWLSVFVQCRTSLHRRLMLSCFLTLASFASLSCNQPFQPKIEYIPKLVLYSVLFANETGVYVRLASTKNSMKSGVAEPIHGANVRLETFLGDDVPLVDSTIVADNDTVSFYFADFPIYPGMQYTITASKQGYDPISATATVPYSSVTIPDAHSYAALRHPDSSATNPTFVINLSGSTAAYFYQLAIEYRGFDSNGQFQIGYVNVLGNGMQDPFNEVSSYIVSGGVDITYYDSLFHYTEQLAGNLKESHLYVDIIVTKIDDPLYRFYITSGRTANPLAMRIDKIIFSNLYNGVGIVGAAAVDTTRIFLF